jgi:hypothetical protein
VVDFDAPAGAFDRVMSIEMFEHMKNYKVSNCDAAELFLPCFVQMLCRSGVTLQCVCTGADGADQRMAEAWGPAVCAHFCQQRTAISFRGAVQHVYLVVPKHSAYLDPAEAVRLSGTGNIPRCRCRTRTTGWRGTSSQVAPCRPATCCCTSRSDAVVMLIAST